jgi:DNA polymerase III sliding clamp (beta) subunit (PCNA family)
MNPPDWNCCSAGQLWQYVAWHLEGAGINTVLVGGAAVSVHTGGVHRTRNLDLVPDDFQRGRIPDVLGRLQFVARRNRDFVHRECPHLSIRFPMGPIEIGGKSPIAPDVIEIEGRQLHLLSPTDCVKDRLASYFHWRSRPFFDQAVLICQNKPGWIDLDQIECWCEAEGAVATFQELKRHLADSVSRRFRVVAMSAENPDAGRHDSEGIRPMILVSATELQSARRILTRLRFERLQSPVLTHVLATVENGAITLAVTDGVHWLESRIPNATAPNVNVRFLIPAKALEDAARSGRGKIVQLDFSDEPGKPLLEVTVLGRSTQTRTIYPTEPASDFPDRPVVEGRTTSVPKETMLAIQIVAVCAATDIVNRPTISGVLFSPENEGVVVASDGKQLVCAPAKVPDRGLILPNAAVHVLNHPDFTTDDVEILMPESAEDFRIQFRSGFHTLIAKTVAGTYPNYRQVIPDHFSASATILESQRTALISWLRALKGPLKYVRLTWEKTGHLTITQQDPGATPMIIEIPVNIDGDPPTISFSARHLANALTIGATIQLLDGMYPCLVSDPSGNFSVLMPVRSSP